MNEPLNLSERISEAFPHAETNDIAVPIESLLHSNSIGPESIGAVLDIASEISNTVGGNVFYGGMFGNLKLNETTLDESEKDSLSALSCVIVGILMFRNGVDVDDVTRWSVSDYDIISRVKAREMNVVSCLEFVSRIIYFGVFGTEKTKFGFNGRVKVMEVVPEMNVRLATAIDLGKASGVKLKPTEAIFEDLLNIMVSMTKIVF